MEIAEETLTSGPLAAWEEPFPVVGTFWAPSAEYGLTDRMVVRAT